MKKGKTYSLKQWLMIGGCFKDLENKPSFSTTGSISGMRKLFFGYSCDLVKYDGYIYKVN